jgi:hypothetical protein
VIRAEAVLTAQLAFEWICTGKHRSTARELLSLAAHPKRAGALSKGEQVVGGGLI